MPEFIEPENWLPNSPDLNPVDSVWSVAKDGVSSQNFRHWPTETRANRLLGSAKPGHVKLSDRSAAKKLMVVIKVKGAHVEFRLD